MSKQTDQREKKVIVIGASIAGLLAARVLADHFEQVLNWYMGKVQLAAHTDAQVSIAFLKVINMVAPPPSILHPRIVWRVLKGNLWPNQRKSRASDPRLLPQPDST
jgi:hypothetical protein